MKNLRRGAWVLGTVLFVGILQKLGVSWAVQFVPFDAALWGAAAWGVVLLIGAIYFVARGVSEQSRATAAPPDHLAAGTHPEQPV